MRPRPTASLVPVALPLLCTGCLVLLEGRYPLENLRVSPGRGFSLQADLFCEVSCGIMYRTWDPAHGATDAYLLGFTIADPGDLTWSLRVSPDDRWAGVADELEPNVILALHDFDTGFDWPSCQGLDQATCDLEAYQGLSALQEPGGDPHILSTQARGGRAARVSP